MVDLRSRREPRNGRQPSERSRIAFTLIEVLLALGLSVVLLAAVGAAIELYRRLTTDAQGDLAEARLVRAVIRKMEADIRAVVPPKPLPVTATSATSSTTSTTSTSSTTSSGSSGSGSSGSSSSTSSSSSSSSSQTSASTDPINSVYSEIIFGLSGDARSIVLNTLCPHPMPVAQTQGSTPSSQNQASQAQTMGVHGDMKTVAYYMSGAGGPVSPLLTAAQAITQMGPDGNPITAGLTRLEGDRVAVGYAMEKSSSLGFAAHILAPEVTALSFRYYDGTNWAVSWDASTLQALPQAVEIMISIGSPNPGGSAGTASQTPARVYRHVIAISTAAPPISVDPTSPSQ